MAPPGSTRTHVLCPYTTHFLAVDDDCSLGARLRRHTVIGLVDIGGHGGIGRAVAVRHGAGVATGVTAIGTGRGIRRRYGLAAAIGTVVSIGDRAARPDEHTSALQSLMRLSYAVFCLTKTK